MSTAGERSIEKLKAFEVWKHGLRALSPRDRVLCIIGRYPYGRQEAEIASIAGLSKRRVKSEIDALMALDIVLLTKRATDTGIKKVFTMMPMSVAGLDLRGM